MSNKALAIYLDGPMQSWGVASRFQYRETENLPTKSGVLGIVAAAIGIDKYAADEAEHLKPLANLQFSVFQAFRIDQQRSVQRLSDFHTVGGGYPDTPQGKLNVSPNAEKSKSGALQWKTPEKRTVPTHRTYLTDARFIAILEGDPDVLSQCADALRNPRWGVWFGRKTCLPASPLCPTLADSGEQALQALAEKAGVTLGEGQIQPSSVEADAWFLPDSPVAYGSREFNSRPVQRS
jgi:CRISPR system Cascade subunit CasD